MLWSRGVRRNRRDIIGLACHPARPGRSPSGGPCDCRGDYRRVRHGAGEGNSDMGTSSRMNSRRPTRMSRVAVAKTAAAVVALGLMLGGCFSETYQRGYIVPEGALEQIPVGSTQEQVLIVLGTPSTVATVSGEAFYYISQRAERAIGFLPQQVVDQRVVAVYFDKQRRVERLANYGLKDGRIFDFVSRATPTGGKDVAYLNALFKIF